MLEKKFIYCGYTVVIIKDYIYDSYNYIIKTFDEKSIISKNKYFLGSFEAAEIAAREHINDI